MGVVRRRVLILNQYYPPDTAATAAIFAEVAGAFMEAGYEVRVVCGRPSYGPSERRSWRPLRRERRSGARVDRVGSTSFDRRRITGRALNYLTYLPLATLRALALPRPDLIVVGSDPPVAVVAALLAARGAPVVYSLRDLHPDMALAAGIVRYGPVARMWERLHGAALRRCALVVTLGERMAERVRAKGVRAERIAVVPDGARPPAHPVRPPVVAELRAGADFCVVHAGNLGAAGAWETLAVAAERSDGGVRFVFVGDGARAHSLRARGLDVVPFRPEGDLGSVMAAGDLQIVCLREGMDGLVVPSKLFTAVAHGRPILAVVPESSETARVVRAWRCGLVADPGDPAAVREVIAWAREHPDEIAAMSRRALDAAAHYDRATLLRDFVRVAAGVSGVR